jgi:hypothetical protein
MRLRRKMRGSMLGDALTGVASGLVASWVMETAQGRIMSAGGSETQRREKEAQGTSSRRPSAPPSARRASSGRASPKIGKKWRRGSSTT